jgi:hypothetical protein
MLIKVFFVGLLNFNLKYGRFSSRDMTMMPLGVPKVAYKMPGVGNRGGGAEWVNIFQRLQRERIIFLGSEIDDELANQIVGMLLVTL